MKTNKISVFLALFSLFAFASLNAQQKDIKVAEPRVAQEAASKQVSPADKAMIKDMPQPGEVVEMTKTDKAPRFVCPEQIADESKLKSCSESAMLKFLYGQISYPAKARHAGTEGVVVVKFVVETDGSITRPEVVRGIGNGCEEEAMRIIKMMPKWTPGERNDQPVAMYYHMPVKFRLH